MFSTKSRTGRTPAVALMSSKVPPASPLSPLCPQWCSTLLGRSGGTLGIIAFAFAAISLRLCDPGGFERSRRYVYINEQVAIPHCGVGKHMTCSCCIRPWASTVTPVGFLHV
ncbi:hypothetical protein BD310DRAFT_699861 [Dichomitus squalens]|uniref:Uncharacterized protein n=1 Tax=Dichomitus squalens TaxID=114155 RepID=A0A4Q9Q6E8_9APHY|nr:hypothetical protein BD310DRAFT_699861 [Dichomitus squalens]